MEQHNEAGAASSHAGSSFRNDIDCLQAVIQTAGIGIWEIHPDKKQVVWDATCRSLFGLREGQDLTFTEMLAQVHPDDVNRVASTYQAALARQNAGRFDIQYRIRTLDAGLLRWVRFSGENFFNAEGELIRFGGIAQDITALVEATQSAREAESLSAMALQSAGAGSFMVYLDNNRMEYSPALARIYTGEESQALDRSSLISHIHPEDLPVRHKAYEAAAQSGRLHYEARTIWNDGSVHWLEAQGQYIPDQNGKPYVFAGVAQEITDRKLSHLAMETRERQVFESFYQAPVGIAIIGKDQLTFRMANAFYSQLVGRDPEQIIGKPLLDALPELRGQGFDKILNDVLETGTPYVQHEARVDLIRDGQPQSIFVDFIYQGMENVHGEVADILVVVTDVTKQVASKKQIAANEAKFRSLIEEAPFATALYTGEDLIIDTANEAMIRLWGKTREVIGMPLDKALPELEGQPFIGLLQTIRTTGETYNARSAPADLMIDGELRRNWFSYTYKPLYDEAGHIYAILNMALDVTEEVLSRNKTEEAQNALINAIELAQLGTWSLDITSGTVVVSDRMKEWFGMSQGTGELEDAVSAIVSADRERVAAAIAEAIQPGAANYNQEYRVRNLKTGQQRIIVAHGRLVLSADNEAIRLDGTARDVTLERELQATLERVVQERTEELGAANEELRVTNEELQSANEELQHSNEELAQYAYVASHDLQEPLRKIRVFSGMLGNSGALSDTERGLIGKITHSAERMGMLIKDLLEFSKLLNSEAIWHPVNLGDVVSSVHNDFELMLTEKAASIEVGPLPVIEASGLQMNQLFYNLIGNALKFTRAGVAPHISVTAVAISPDEAAEHVGKVLPFAVYHRISVADNGIGFDVSYTEQIFEVFKRLHGREVYPGSGIGLALCRRITGNHQGALYAESTPGQGSVFHVVLPDKQEAFVSSLPPDFRW